MRLAITSVNTLTRFFVGSVYEIIISIQIGPTICTLRIQLLSCLISGFSVYEKKHPYLRYEIFLLHRMKDLTWK